MFCWCLFLCTLFAKTPQQSTGPKTNFAIDFILIEESKRLMTTYSHKKPIKTYKVALGFSPLGHKMQEGDGKTPEGIYDINGKLPNSEFHRALQISYPNQKDKLNAKKLGVSAGGQIMIHGLGKSFSWLGALHTAKDWTLGCIAVTDQEITEIFNNIKNGTKAQILP